MNQDVQISFPLADRDADSKNLIQIILDGTLPQRSGIRQIVEDRVHLLEGAPTRLLKEKEDVGQRSQTQGAKDHVELPLDVLEGGKGEECETEIAALVEGGCERDGFRADIEGKDFGWADPILHGDQHYSRRRVFPSLLIPIQHS